MIKLKDIIKESKFPSNQELYHYTSIVNAMSILRSNEMKIDKNKFLRDITLKQISVFSFSRSKIWMKYPAGVLASTRLECAIAVNAHLLSTKYKIVSFNWYNRHQNNFSKSDENFEYEDRVVLQNKNLKNKTLKDINVNDPDYPNIPNFNRYVKYLMIKKNVLTDMSTDQFNSTFFSSFINFDNYINIIKSQFPDPLILTKYVTSNITGKSMYDVYKSSDSTDIHINNLIWLTIIHGYIIYRLNNENSSKNELFELEFKKMYPNIPLLFV